MSRVWVGGNVKIFLNWKPCHTHCSLRRRFHGPTLHPVEAALSVWNRPRDGQCSITAHRQGKVRQSSARMVWTSLIKDFNQNTELRRTLKRLCSLLVFGDSLWRKVGGKNGGVGSDQRTIQSSVLGFDSGQQTPDKDKVHIPVFLPASSSLWLKDTPSAEVIPLFLTGGGFPQ